MYVCIHICAYVYTILVYIYRSIWLQKVLRFAHSQPGETVKNRKGLGLGLGVNP